MMDLQQRIALIRTAEGSEKADLVIINGTLVNVYSGELLKGYGVAVRGEHIAYIGKDVEHSVGPATEVIDATGKIVVPGFIDAHIHMCYYCSPGEFLKYSLKGGTTTIVTELIELSFPLGSRGIIEYMESCRDQPAKIFGVIPTMVTLSSRAAEETISREEIRGLLSRKDLLGLGETYWQALAGGNARLLEYFGESGEVGKVISGHSAGAKGRKLAAYVAGGVTSCHEPITMEEVLERLRLGLHVLVREGEIRRDLGAIKGIQKRAADLRRLSLVSDGVSLKQLVEEGHMDIILQRAIDQGLDPVTAIQMVTINPAEYLNLAGCLGGIAPGRCADMVIIPDLHTIQAEYVISKGRIAARQKELLVQPRRHVYPSWMCQYMRIRKKFSPEDFQIRVQGDGPAKVRVIEQVTGLVTKESFHTVLPRAGMIEADTGRDLLKVSSIDFQSRTAKQFVGLIKGHGLKKGAIATSMAWDLTNIVVVGADEEDMALAVNRIVEMQGGIVVSAAGQILAELPLPIGGYLSNASIEELQRGSEKIQLAAAGLGFPFAAVNITLITLTTPAIPFLRICEDGLIDVRTGGKVDLIIS
ncbi:MAG: adenine deaminase C-terminal domain-containing protein [Dethiobacteria bacterium]|jgi:adenine deaminase